MIVAMKVAQGRLELLRCAAIKNKPSTSQNPYPPDNVAKACVDAAKRVRQRDGVKEVNDMEDEVTQIWVGRVGRVVVRQQVQVSIASCNLPVNRVCNRVCRVVS